MDSGISLCDAKPQAIVLPIRIQEDSRFSGIGLAFHFLLGNVLVLCTRLKEMWFGWRVKAIFPKKETLLSFCRGEGSEPNIGDLGAEQKIRYWFSGHIAKQEAIITLTDTEVKRVWVNSIPFSMLDHHIGFRNTFLEWIETCGISFAEMERRKALWPEKLPLEGLDAVGRALLAFYLFSSYQSETDLNVEAIATASKKYPFSYMARNLLGWVRYRRAEYDSAKTAFLEAVNLNQAGAGAMAGLMWCSVMMNQQKDAIDWAASKAETQGEAVEAAKEKAMHLINRQKKT